MIACTSKQSFWVPLPVLEIFVAEVKGAIYTSAEVGQSTRGSVSLNVKGSVS